MFELISGYILFSIIVTISAGFFFAIGVGIAYILFQISLLILRQIYISYVVKRFKKYTKKPTKPKGMEFGDLND